MITLSHYLALAGLLFVVGLFGALAKRNAVAVLMGIELMLNAVNINLVAFNRFMNPGEVTGQVFALFVIVVAAAEVAVGLAIVINLYRRRLATDVEEADWLKW
ncbi:MAG TPA: NADH-quinone oxidoreductase subunit NuoK [Peptococcaceae bacterium]|nr:MAG: NADH-quinone oxidoreductase subunit K [Moorella sp. 60_41]HBT46306.1 NADH-quinone oxidoreductase subunit NuoK [Peptococcaceae bacterium]